MAGRKRLGPLPGCLARIRTYDSLRQREALTTADAPLDAHKIGSDALLFEIMERWPKLSEEIKRAVLAAVRACSRKEGG
jgi:hypothetical protein